MEITCSLYNFLVQNDILPPQSTRISDILVAIPKPSCSILESATTYAKVLKLLDYLKTPSEWDKFVQLPTLDSNELISQQVKKFNWNGVLIALGKGDKKQIAANFRHFLLDLQDYIETIHPNYKKLLISRSFTPTKKAQNKEKVNILDIKEGAKIEESTNSLELLTIAICQSFHLTSVQVVTFFSENFLILSHILVKGCKGQFDPVIQLFSILQKNSSSLAALCTQEDKLSHFYLNALKFGLFSRNEAVCKACSKFFKDFGSELDTMKLHQEAWEWFIGDNQNGLLSCIQGIKRHPQAVSEIVEVIYEFGKHNLKDLLTLYLKIEIPDQVHFFQFISFLVPHLKGNQQIIQNFEKEGVFDDWIETSFQTTSQDFQYPLRIVSLSFLTEIWIHIPKVFEKEKQNSAILMQELIDASREPIEDKGEKEGIRVVSFSSLTMLFRILQKQGSLRSPTAPLIYKNIAELLVSSICDIQIREFIINNLIDIFKELQSIPVDIAIQPFVKEFLQLDVSITQNLSQIDLNLIQFAISHNHLKEQLVLELLEFLGKIYIRHLIFWSIAIIPLLQLLKQYIGITSIQEFACNLTKALLAMYFASEKTIGQIINSNDKTLLGSKRKKIIKLLMGISDIKSPELTKRIKPLVAHTAIQIEYSIQTESKGIKQVLSLFGSPDQIIEECKSELLKIVQQEQAKRDEEERQLQLQKSIEDSRQKMVEDIEQSEKRRDGSGKRGDGMSDIVLKGEGKLAVESQILKKFDGEEDKMIQSKKKKQNENERKLKVSRMIEEKKISFSAKKESNIQQKENQQLQMQEEKKKLKQLLDERKIQLGVAENNIQDKEANLLFEFNSLKPIEKQFNWIESINLMEDRDKRMLRYSRYKIKPFLRVLFYKYSNSVQRFDSGPGSMTFDGMLERSNKISLAEVWRFMKDFNISLFQTQDSLRSIFRGIETQQEQMALSFKGFQSLIIELAMRFCRNSPRDYSHLPFSCSLDLFFENMKQNAKQNRYSTLALDDEYAGMPEVIRELTKKIKANPEIQLPRV